MKRKPNTHRRNPPRALTEPERSIAVMKKSLARGDAAEATMLFERLNTTHWVPRRPDLVPWLNREIGAHATTLLVKSYAALACHFCRGEWAMCPTCDGVGEDDRDRACKTCSGLGLGCCTACDGAGLVNYAAVPVGLRGAVIKARMALAAKRIRGLRGAGAASAARAGERLQSAIAVRSVVSNAMRAAAEKPPGVMDASDVVPRAMRARLDRTGARLLAEADVALRVAVTDMAELERRAAERGGRGAASAERRFVHLIHLAGREVFVSPLLMRRNGRER